MFVSLRYILYNFTQKVQVNKLGSKIPAEMHWICRCRAHWTGGTIRVMHFQYIQHLKVLRIEQNCIGDFEESTGQVEHLQN